VSAEPTLALHTDIRGHSTVVTFQLGRQIYALPIESIVRIVEMVAITPIPRTNHSVEGVINYKGVTVPVVNLRGHLGLPIVPFGLDTHIVIAQTGERTIGLVVDQVLDVSDFPKIQISRPEDILPKSLGQAPFLQGVVQTPHGMVLVLDLQDLLSSDQAEMLVRAAEALDQETEQDAEKTPSLPAPADENEESDQQAEVAQEQETEMEVQA
jgi:purine-binding chemotaxis protein CheW